MSGIEENGVVDLWDRITDQREQAGLAPLTLKMRYFELAGKKCVDLLGEDEGDELRLLSDGKMSVKPVGATEAEINSPEQVTVHFVTVHFVTVFPTRNRALCNCIT